MEQYLRREKRRQWWVLSALCLLLVIIFCVNLVSGAFPVSLHQLIEGLSSLQRQVLFELRLPRAFIAVLTGAGLAVAGAVLQVLLQNPIAEPGLTGISGGASLAAVLVMVGLGHHYLPGWAVSAAAFLGALVVTVLMISMARWRKLDTARLLLLGIAIGILTNAAMSWILFFSSDHSLREILFWMMGSLSYGQHRLAWWWLPFVLVLGWLCSQGSILDRLMLGEEQARLLGIDMGRVQRRLIVGVCLVTGFSVAMAGVIGFIGLVVPHLVRLALGNRQRFVLPASALLGACLLLAADLAARTLLSAGELPIGVVTATFGAPVFIYMLVRSNAVS
nr:vitamin B12 ABC transporter permease BtuC [Dongshaea marina]